MAKTPGEMEAAILRKIPVKTGKSLEKWMAIIKKDGPGKPDDIKEWLKEEYGFGGGQAGTLSAYYQNGGKATYGDTEALLEEQFSGQRVQFRPVYSKLKKEIRKLDNDIRFEPCKTYVSIIAKYQFAIAQPANTELKLGLALNDDVPENKILKKAKTLGSDKITHYISLKTKSDVEYAMGFVKEAYIRHRNKRKIGSDAAGGQNKT